MQIYKLFIALLPIPERELRVTLVMQKIKNLKNVWHPGIPEWGYGSAKNRKECNLITLNYNVIGRKAKAGYLSVTRIGDPGQKKVPRRQT